MSPLRFYYDLMSQPSRALFIIFRLSGMQFEDCVVALRNGRCDRKVYLIDNVEHYYLIDDDFVLCALHAHALYPGISLSPPVGEHLTDEFQQKINRFQRVPCINDNGYKLAESVAILRYLSAKGKIPESLYPKYFVEQARVDEFLEWQHITLRVTCALYFRTIWLDPLLTGRSPSEAKIETLRIHMERNLDIIEDIWLAKSEYLTGPTLTVADILAACEIEQTRE